MTRALFKAFRAQARREPLNPFILGLVLTLLGIAFGAVITFASPAEASPKADDLADTLADSNAAATACLMQQNVPVQGFKGKVVCLKPDGGIAWVR